ncbi:hypothetical protein [Arthrobacter sp. OY3WO11]|uniref:hypothetical protein n=1 Tax=Arthrobacter sp. OY3WO11 TaxID=1835723 RepID=UPI000A5F129C|nr:hypothetical protein [Arthrobacter sp. OY3WO11]
MGASFAVILELGWGLTGPQRIARQSLRNRQQTLAVALSTKFVLIVPLVAAASIVSYNLSSQYRWEAAAVAAGSTAYALNSTWYFIGTGSSAKILYCDAIPRLFGVAIAAILIFAGGELVLYPVIGILLPICVSGFLVIRSEDIKLSHLKGMSVRRLQFVVASQSSALGARSLSAIYMSLPITLVSLVAPGAVAVFSAIERLQRIYLQVLAAVPNVMQKWVGQSLGGRRKIRRAKKSVLYNAVMGFVAGSGFTVAAPIMAEIVFSSTIKISLEYAAISGVLIFIVCTSRATGSIALVAFNRVNAVFLSAAAGVTVGIPGILLGARFFGPPGALIGEVLAELTVLCIQMRAMRNIR